MSARLGVLSDVHANLPALEAALGALDGCDELLCAGDLVGYGPHPNECVALLREAGARSVYGNHELVALGRAPLERCDALAATTLAWTRGAISAGTRAYLDQLPATLERGELIMTHGAPGDAWHYVRDPADAATQLARVPQAGILVVGHTHVAAAVDEEGRAAPLDDITLGDVRWLLNPGSVGQSREREPLVRVLELDLDARTARFRALPYDIERTRAALRAAGLPLEAAHRRPRPWRARAARLLGRT